MYITSIVYSRIYVYSERNIPVERATERRGTTEGYRMYKSKSLVGYIAGTVSIIKVVAKSTTSQASNIPIRINNYMFFLGGFFSLGAAMVLILLCFSPFLCSRLYQCKEFASCETEIASRAGVGRIIERNPNEMTCLLRDFLGANSSRPKSRVWQLLYLKAKKKRKENKRKSNSSITARTTTTDSI